MEMTADTLVELCEQFKREVEEYRKVEPKVDTSNIVATFDETERAIYDEIVDGLDRIDALVHANYNSRIAVAVHEKIRKFESDSKARRDYLQSIETKRVAVSMDEESEAKLQIILKLRKKIDATRMFLEAEGITLPASLFKKSEKTGNLLLDLPKTPGDNSTSETSGTRGRPSKSKLLILGIVNAKGQTHWYDFDHVGKTFAEVFGTIRADACPPGLWAAVEKAGITNYLKDGWTTPVEYAGKKWVSKVREG